jgi:hypothetical protein
MYQSITIINNLNNNKNTFFVGNILRPHAIITDPLNVNHDNQKSY